MDAIDTEFDRLWRQRGRRVVAYAIQRERADAMDDEAAYTSHNYDHVLMDVPLDVLRREATRVRWILMASPHMTVSEAYALVRSIPPHWWADER